MDSKLARGGCSLKQNKISFKIKNNPLIIGENVKKTVDTTAQLCFHVDLLSAVQSQTYSKTTDLPKPLEWWISGIMPEW